MRGRHERAEVGGALRVPHLVGLLFVKVVQPVQRLGNAGVALDESGIGEGLIRVVLHALSHGANVEPLLLQPVDELMGEGKLIERPEVRSPLDDEYPLLLGVVPPQDDLTIDVQEQVVQSNVLFNRPEGGQEGLLLLDSHPCLLRSSRQEVLSPLRRRRSPARRVHRS